MNTLWLLTKKNLQVLVRAKSSALIVIFAPLLIILLLGLSYNTDEQYAVKIGIYASTFSDDVLAFTNLLEEQNFTVIKYESEIAPCLEDIKSGYVHTCISLPETFKIESNTPREVTFYIDPTRINLVWMIQETVGKKFELRGNEISQQLTQEVLTRVEDSRKLVTQEKADLNMVKEKANGASSATNQAQQNLKTVDLIFTPHEANSGSLDQLKSQLATTSSKLGEISVQVNRLNITSSDKTRITSLVGEAGIAVNSSVLLIEGNDTGSLAALISQFEQDIALAKQKITTASEKVQQTSSNLDSSKTSMQETISALESVATDLVVIESKLAAQKITQAETITSPLRTRIEKISPDGTYLSYLFPAILILVIMFSSLALGTTLVMIEKNSPAYFRNFFLPIRKVTFITSIYLTNLILTVVQIVVVLGIALFFLQDSYTAFPLVALILFIAASVFTFIGMVVGYMFNSEETAILASISVGSLCLFVSGVILPLEAINPLVEEVVSFNPFVISEKLVREVFIFQAPFTQIWMDLLVLLSYAVLLFLAILLIESLFHEHLVSRFMKHHHPKHKEEEKKEN
ncbi:ABC transporter permease [Candidatus Woesearchaeota archaeon]|nr:ABC transporter permease [Candidatus Woesearchaeota archaeon]